VSTSDDVALAEATVEASDICVSLVQGSPEWPASQYEPLVCALTCPILSSSPWQVKRQNWVDEWRCQVQRLWREGGKLGGIICANFGLVRGRGLDRCVGAWHAACFRQHEKDVFPVLGVQDVDAALVDESLLEDEDPMRFREAREGDHLLCPFQCDRCHFVNMRKREPRDLNIFDLLVLTCIRRAILDSVWARERLTVNSNRLEGVRYLGICTSMGMEEEAYPARGPYPIVDNWGMKGARAILIRSKDRGRIELEGRTTCSFDAGRTFQAENRRKTILSAAGADHQFWNRHTTLDAQNVIRVGEIWVEGRADVQEWNRGETRINCGS
jgi:hypothetical protein